MRAVKSCAARLRFEPGWTPAAANNAAALVSHRQRKFLKFPKSGQTPCAKKANFFSSGCKDIGRKND
ncbi:hypothetical protein DWB58_18950 [candidate division KSB1 bacterium]|nr:hypothetical protein [candidate division KSB1 bacterium]